MDLDLDIVRVLSANTCVNNAICISLSLSLGLGHVLGHVHVDVLV